jgi:broad specificity phosphatase PhoE
MHTTNYLIRHGETAGNRIRRVQRYNTALSRLGRSQAQLLATRLEAERPLSALYTSDLLRARQTAAVIGRRIGLTPAQDTRLRELDAGDWKGALDDDIEARTGNQVSRWMAAGGLERLPGETGESTADVHARVNAAFKEIVSRHLGGKVAVVSHSWALSLLLASVFEYPFADAFREQRFHLNNASVTVVKAEAECRYCCELFNCTAHLSIAN